MNRQKSEEKKDESMVRQTIRVRPNLWYRVKAVAAWNHKSVNDAVIEALEAYVKPYAEALSSMKKGG
jgi:predicted HicB family RNase H-like nuclease